MSILIVILNNPSVRYISLDIWSKKGMVKKIKNGFAHTVISLIKIQEDLH